MKDEIQQLLGKHGISVVGISAARHLPGVPSDFSPHALLGNAASVICFGVPVPRGILHANAHSLMLYWRYCNMVYRTLDMAANDLCIRMEEERHVAFPLYGCFPWKVSEGKFWGLLPLVHWAEQAGLGRLTRCGLLANPSYGTRLLLGGVVTSAVLESSSAVDREPCPDTCFRCMEACPVHAISDSGEVDHNLCIRYSGANPLLAHLLEDRLVREKFSFETIVNTAGVDDHGAYTCFACVKACPLNR